jgi:hypothetical protein
MIKMGLRDIDLPLRLTRALPCRNPLPPRRGRLHDRSPAMGEHAMTAFNIVRFRVKPGRDQEFLDAHNDIAGSWPGLKHVNMIKTGDRSYCIVAEWTDLDAIGKARPQMIATLNSFRDTLEDLGNGLGVTDPVAGPVVLALK